MIEQDNKAMTGKDWAVLLLLGLIWGSSFLFANIAVKEIPPFTLVLLRVGLASIALCVVMLLQGLSFRPFLQNWHGFALLGLLSCALPFFLIFYSQQSIGPGLGGILNATVPIFMVPLAHFLTKDEKLTWQKTFGVVAGFIGVVILVGPAALSQFGGSALAELAALGASFSYALGGLQARRFRHYPALVISTGGLLAATVVMLPLSLLADHSLSLPAPSLGAWGAVLSLSLLSTAFAFLMFYWLVRRTGVTNASLVTFIIPISAVLLGVFFRAEILTLSDLAGILIVGLSLAILDGRLFRKRDKKNTIRPEESIVCK